MAIYLTSVSYVDRGIGVGLQRDLIRCLADVNGAVLPYVILSCFILGPAFVLPAYLCPDYRQRPSLRTSYHMFRRLVSPQQP